MADGFSARYAISYGSYDCVDRIVLNAYHTLCYQPGGFRTWWRRLHGGDGQLGNAHLMRMAGRFARRVRASAAAHGIPVIDCKRGERKHQIAEEYLACGCREPCRSRHVTYSCRRPPSRSRRRVDEQRGRWGAAATGAVRRARRYLVDLPATALSDEEWHRVRGRSRGAQAGRRRLQTMPAKALRTCRPAAWSRLASRRENGSLSPGPCRQRVRRGQPLAPAKG